MAYVYDHDHDRDLGEVTDPNALAYYEGEGYEISDDEAAHKAAPAKRKSAAKVSTDK